MTARQPEITLLNAPYWQGLQQGRLLYQRCSSCSYAWLPARECCPRCLGERPAWVAASGIAKVVSWVVYHVAYDEAFKSRIPYDVTLVELEEGPRLLTNVIDSNAGRRLALGARVRLKIENEGDTAVARFMLNGESDH